MPTDTTSRLGATLDLLEKAQTTLLEACEAQTTTDRYIHAHLGALRAAAALLAARAVPSARWGSRIRNVWEGLGQAAPELSEWADYLALAGSRRAELEAGTLRVTTREADDLLRAAETFLCHVQAALGLPVIRCDRALAVTGPA